MFKFVVTYLGFLKHVPLLPHLFDAMLKIGLVMRSPAVSDCLDDIEQEVLSWRGTSLHFHKFGGVQFDAREKEIGHIHGNGLLDILFSREDKARFLSGGRVKEHHVFKDSGWISFYIRTDDDRKLALDLLRYSYDKKVS